MLEDDRIQQIKAPGNTLVDACNGKPNCKLIDDTTGILTFLPSPLYQTRAFTINLLTEKGFFYNVSVEPKPIASQTIVFKTYKNPIIRAREPHTSSYEKVMVGFLRALVNGYVPEGFTQTIPKKTAIYKAQRTQLKRLLIVKGNRMRGEIFELKNHTNKPIDAKESWFNWSGTKGVALAKSHLGLLKPLVYIGLANMSIQLKKQQQILLGIVIGVIVLVIAGFALLGNKTVKSPKGDKPAYKRHSLAGPISTYY